MRRALLRARPVRHQSSMRAWAAPVCDIVREAHRGRFNADAAGMGVLGFVFGTTAVKEGLARYRSTFVDSEWTGNQAGNGAAIIVKGENDVQVDRCLFRDNVATKGG